jgi:ABC-2 type transport system permease protein/lipopolysaccharide transport system permease protein
MTWKENTARGVARENPFGALWRSRELIAHFALRDIRLRYRQAFLGVIWVLAQPVVSVAVFTLVFSRLANIPSQGVPYPLFALVGMVAWTYFSSAVLAGSSVLVANASLITKVYFPRMAAPASALIPPAVDLAVSLGLVAVVAMYYGVFSGIRLLAVPLWLLLLAIPSFGMSLWLSALNVKYRDVQYAVAPVLQVWLFASPVAYPPTLLHGWAEFVYSLNPMVGVIQLGRWSLLATPWPGWSLVVSAGTAIGLLVAGFTYFNRAQRQFADVV